jgi:hypothetical protein
MWTIPLLRASAKSPVTGENSISVLSVVWGLFIHSLLVDSSKALRGFIIDVAYIFSQFWRYVPLFHVDTLYSVDLPFRKYVQYGVILILLILFRGRMRVKYQRGTCRNGSFSNEQLTLLATIFQID